MIKFYGVVNDVIVGYLYLVPFIDEDNLIHPRQMIMTSLFIYENCREKGYARTLLWSVYDAYKQNNQKNWYNDYHVDAITWGDCSDRYRQDDNLYLKIGAYYKEEGDPEMVWDIRSSEVEDLRKQFQFSENIHIYITNE